MRTLAKVLEWVGVAAGGTLIVCAVLRNCFPNGIWESLLLPAFFVGVPSLLGWVWLTMAMDKVDLATRAMIDSAKAHRQTAQQPQGYDHDEGTI